MNEPNEWMNDWINDRRLCERSRGIIACIIEWKNEWMPDQMKKVDTWMKEWCKSNRIDGLNLSFFFFKSEYFQDEYRGVHRIAWLETAEPEKSCWVILN